MDKLWSDGCVATMVKPRVVAEQQTNTYPRVISAQQTDSGLMAALQWMANLRVVTNRRTYLMPQATSTQQIDFSLMAMLQRTTMLRVVARPQALIGPVAKSACPYRPNTPRLRGNASHIPERREVEMIFKGPCEVGNGRRARDKYA